MGPPTRLVAGRRDVGVNAAPPPPPPQQQQQQNMATLLSRVEPLLDNSILHNRRAPGNTIDYADYPLTYIGECTSTNDFPVTPNNCVTPFVPEWHARFFTEKDGGRYCRLCGLWADTAHIGSKKHKKRAQNPDLYLWDDDMDDGSHRSSGGNGSPPPPPFPFLGAPPPAPWMSPGSTDPSGNSGNSAIKHCAWCSNPAVDRAVQGTRARYCAKCWDWWRSDGAGATGGGRPVALSSGYVSRPPPPPPSSGSFLQPQPLWRGSATAVGALPAANSVSPMSTASAIVTAGAVASGNSGVTNSPSTTNSFGAANNSGATNNTVAPSKVGGSPVPSRTSSVLSTKQWLDGGTV